MNTYRSSRSRKGFTLTEVVVALVLLMLIAGIATVFYTTVLSDSRDNIATISARAYRDSIDSYASQQRISPADLVDVPENILETPDGLLATELPRNATATLGTVNEFHVVTLCVEFDEEGNAVSCATITLSEVLHGTSRVNDIDGDTVEDDDEDSEYCQGVADCDDDGLPEHLDPDDQNPDIDGDDVRDGDEDPGCVLDPDCNDDGLFDGRPLPVENLACVPVSTFNGVTNTNPNVECTWDLSETLFPNPGEHTQTDFGPNTYTITDGVTSVDLGVDVSSHTFTNVPFSTTRTVTVAVSNNLTNDTVDGKGPAESSTDFTTPTLLTPPSTVPTPEYVVGSETSNVFDVNVAVDFEVDADTGVHPGNRTDHQMRRVTVGTWSDDTTQNYIVNLSTEVCAEAQSRRHDIWGWSDWSAPGPRGCYTTSDRPDAPASSPAPSATVIVDETPDVRFTTTSPAAGFQRQILNQLGNWISSLTTTFNSVGFNSTQCSQTQTRVSNEWGWSPWTESSNGCATTGAPPAPPSSSPAPSASIVVDETPDVVFTYAAAPAGFTREIQTQSGGWTSDSSTTFTGVGFFTNVCTKTRTRQNTNGYGPSAWTESSNGCGLTGGPPEAPSSSPLPSGSVNISPNPSVTFTYQAAPVGSQRQILQQNGSWTSASSTTFSAGGFNKNICTRTQTRVSNGYGWSDWTESSNGCTWVSGPPSPPSNVWCSEVVSSQPTVNCSWSSVSGATSYEYRWDANDVSSAPGSTTGNSASANDVGFFQTARLYVKACNGYGCGNENSGSEYVSGPPGAPDLSCSIIPPASGPNAGLPTAYCSWEGSGNDVYDLDYTKPGSSELIDYYESDVTYESKHLYGLFPDPGVEPGTWIVSFAVRDENGYGQGSWASWQEEVLSRPAIDIETYNCSVGSSYCDGPWQPTGYYRLSNAYPKTFDWEWRGGSYPDYIKFDIYRKGSSSSYPSTPASSAYVTVDVSGGWWTNQIRAGYDHKIVMTACNYTWGCTEDVAYWYTYPQAWNIGGVATYDTSSYASSTVGDTCASMWWNDMAGVSGWRIRGEVENNYDSYYIYGSWNTYDYLGDDISGKQIKYASPTGTTRYVTREAQTNLTNNKNRVEFCSMVHPYDWAGGEYFFRIAPVGENGRYNTNAAHSYNIRQTTSYP